MRVGESLDSEKYTRNCSDIKIPASDVIFVIHIVITIGKSIDLTVGRRGHCLEVTTNKVVLLTITCCVVNTIHAPLKRCTQRAAFI